MKLKLYLVENEIKVHEFAKILGCSRTHLSEVINGKKKAGLTLAKFIEQATNGKVTADEVLNAYKNKGE